MRYYSLDDYGYIKSHGISPEFGDLIAEDDEPFFLSNEGNVWRYAEFKWINEKEGYRYFLIPSDMVPQISVYSDFVKESLFHLAFNVHINDINTIVEGIEYKSPLYINFIPCSCTRWTDEGLLLLDAVVENWNHSNPLKQITFSVKFESYNEFIEFRNSKKI